MTVAPRDRSLQKTCLRCVVGPREMEIPQAHSPSGLSRIPATHRRDRGCCGGLSRRCRCPGGWACRCSGRLCRRCSSSRRVRWLDREGCRFGRRRWLARTAAPASPGVTWGQQSSCRHRAAGRDGGGWVGWPHMASLPLFLSLFSLCGAPPSYSRGEARSATQRRSGNTKWEYE